jgi:hypothetical protein
MLIANKIADKGFRKDLCFEVAMAGAVVGILNGTRSTFELENKPFSIGASGVIQRELHLKSGSTVIATAIQKPLRNNYTVTAGGKEWVFKATNMVATEFGLFENEIRVGTISAGSFFNRLKDIKADLPDQMPREVQMFLLAMFISELTSPSS